MRVPIDNVVYGLKDCSGSSGWLLHEFVVQRVRLKAETINDGKPELITHPDLKEVYFAEAQHFVTRALYHLCVGKVLVLNRTPTWGLVSFYYASFFAAQAAIRLRGTAFFRLSYDDEINRAPTFRLTASNFVSDKFAVQRTGQVSRGEHQRVWNAFYDNYNSFGGRAGYADVSPVTELVGAEERLAEMHRRHLVNYVPGEGYSEFVPGAALSAMIASLGQSVRGRMKEALDDPDGQLEAGAFLRFRLCCGLLQEIAAVKGKYEQHHANLVSTRRRLLDDWKCPSGLMNDLVAVM